MAFPVHHGIKLAANGYIENLHVEILASDPVPVSAGRVWFNSTDKVFKQSTLDGVGAVVVRSFATVEALNAAIAAEESARQAADAAIQSELDATQAGAGLGTDGAYTAPVGSNYLGSATSLKNADTLLDTQIKTVADNLATEISRATAAEDALDARVDTIEANYVKKDGSVAMTGNLNLDGNKVVNVGAPTANSDAANKVYVDNAIAALGNAFEYVGVVEGGATNTSGVRFDLNTLVKKSAGDYYKVSVAGWFVMVEGTGTPFFANVGDGLVFNTTSGVDKIDNTDTNVQGTASYIAVSGSVDTGFTVDIDSAFKTRMTNAEAELVSQDGRLDTIEASYIHKDGSVAFTAAQSMGSNKLTSLADGTVASDAVNKGQLDTAVAAEAAARTAADDALDGRLDTIEAAYIKKDGTVAFTADQSMGSNKLTNVANGTAASDAVNKGQLDSAVAAEAALRSSGDSALQSELDATQAGAGLDASGAYTAPVGSNYLGAATSLKNADSLLDTQVKAVADNVALALTKSAFNALRYKETTTVAATTHTITHNLGSTDVDVGLWIDAADDGKFVNSIASIEIFSANAIKVYLSVAKNIKVLVEKFDPIA